MKIYTASAFANYERVRAFNDDLRAAGNEVTWDWTRTDEFDKQGHPIQKVEAKIDVDTQRKHAELDRDGVLDADLLIALFDEGRPNGGLMEFGAAAFKGTPCYVLRPHEWSSDSKYSIFYQLHNVYVFELEDAIRALLGMRIYDRFMLEGTAPGTDLIGA